MLMLISLLGCKSSILLHDSREYGGIKIDAYISDKKIIKYKEKTIVYGRLIFNKVKKMEVDLNIFPIEINGIFSEKIYIDSIADYLPGKYIINNKDDGVVHVYWVMCKEVELEGKAFFKLNINESSDCK